MNKFWQWMKDKDYGETNCLLGKSNNHMRTAVEPTPQMLIGYKLEYVRDHAFWNGIEEIWSGDQMMINNRLSMLWNCIDIAKEIDDIIMIIDNEEQ